MKTLAELAPILSSPKRIAITHHFNPDADALGSSLGLFHYFNQLGHSCKVISPNAIPDFLLWMPHSTEVLIYEESKLEVENVLSESEILFSLDYNQYARTQTLASSLGAFNGVKVLIDHHLFPDTLFDYGLSMPAKSSTCEMVYDFINSNDHNELINLDMAKCLYAGVMTDTGSFKFPCTTASVHSMVADLMNKGLETSPVQQAIFDTYRENRLRFLGYVLAEKMMLDTETHSSIIAVTKEELNRFQLKTGDTEGIVNYPLSIQDIIFSTFISERDNEIRMSFRSKGHFDVNEFARTYFNGGGHANAAGGRSHDSLSITIDKYKNAITQTENQLKQCYKELIW